MSMLSIVIYAIIGGILFSILGVAATYTREEKPTTKTVSRDWAAGIIITVILHLISPSLMPPITWAESIKVPTSFSGGNNSSTNTYSLISDYPLQIGIQSR
jgi:hypothetical protein